MKNNICPKCNSNKVIPKVRILDHDYGINKNLSVQMKNSNHKYFYSTTESQVVAYICGDCGFMETYVTDYKDLWDIYKKKGYKL